MKPIQDSTHFTRQRPPYARLNLTERDLDLMSALVRQVRLLSINQVANSWWPHAKNTRSCARRISQLAAEGFIRQLQVMSHPLMQLDTWLIKWEKNKPKPNFEAASYKMKKRWTLAPENMSVIVATKRTTAQLAELAEPLVMRMKFLLLQSKVIHTDDTSIKLLEGKGIAHTAKFWPYLGDADHPYIVFDFTRTRGRDGPTKFLAGFEGYLQADAYSGYDRIYAGDKVKEVACWVHARRYWYQAVDNDALRANQALSFIARLSQLEKQLRKSYPQSDLQGHRDFGAVAAARQEHAAPILKAFKSWLDDEKDNKRILPKSPIRSAFTYTLNQWEALCRYCEEGYLSFSNNVAERAVKIPAIGRKNYLFVASSNGGCRAAIHYSLVSSAKANGVEPFAWLKDVFSQLPHHRGGEAFAQAAENKPVSSDELDYLLPDAWLNANPSHNWNIDEIRRKEREAKNV